MMITETELEELESSAFSLDEAKSDNFNETYQRLYDKYRAEGDSAALAEMKKLYFQQFIWAVGIWREEYQKAVQ